MVNIREQLTFGRKSLEIIFLLSFTRTIIRVRYYSIASNFIFITIVDMLTMTF